MTDKVLLSLVSTAFVSGGALAFNLLTSPGGMAAAPPAVQVQADPEAPEESETDEEVVEELSLDDCLDWQDPRDPSMNPANGTSADDEILDAALSESDFAREFISTCDLLSNATNNRAQQIQAQYAVARFEAALDRTFDAKDRYKGLAEEHASSAWRLAQMNTQGVLPEPTEVKFEETLDLLSKAHRGGDNRADDELREIMSKIFPLSKMQMPTLVSSLYLDRSVPDSLTTRKAMISYFDGYVEYCSKWSHIDIEPRARAAVENAKLDLKAGSFGPALQQVPKLFGQMLDWANNLENRSLVGMVKDVNMAAATPAQMMYVVDKAAARDGYMHAEALQCTSKRSGELIDRLIRRIVSTATTDTPPPDPSHIGMLAQPVDVLDMI